MKDFLYDYPFLVVFLFLVFVALGLFVWRLFLIAAFGLFLVSLFDRRITVAILISSVLAFVFFKGFSPKVCNLSKVIGNIVDVKFGSHLTFLVKSEKCKLLLFAPSRFDNLRIGDRAIFYVKVKPIDSLKNQSFRQYLFSIGVDGVGFVRYAKRTGKNKFISFIEHIREKIENEFYYFLPSKVEYFLDSAFLGDSRYKSRIKKDFIDTQTAHILAVSGVHMGFVFGMFYFLFYELVSMIGFIYRRFNLKIVASNFALVPTMLYFAISGMHIPAIRSFAMMMLFILAVVFSLRKNSLNGLFLVGSLFLVFNLRSIFNPSFVMSFVMTLFAIVFYEMLSVLKLPVKWAVFVVLMSLFATPLTVYYFGKLSVFSFVYNAIVVPLFGFVVVPVAFLLLLFSFLPYGGIKVFLFKIGSFIVSKFLALVSFLSSHAIVMRVKSDFIMILFVYVVLVSFTLLLSKLLSRLNSQSQTHQQSFS
ncbi:ComEC/Rec2 family competence protein [Hippea alviniae]|uniref:ComEC/Rec2 family competence protein n=1 Tax=Hippea alviniae TaxID=1279027 RepID=UPI0003B78101|nr:ComEC/Rec2 family competence protein [Hippea alviniae]